MFFLLLHSYHYALHGYYGALSLNLQQYGTSADGHEDFARQTEMIKAWRKETLYDLKMKIFLANEPSPIW